MGQQKDHEQIDAQDNDDSLLGSPGTVLMAADGSEVRCYALKHDHLDSR